jgi:hypothetical protein
MRSSSPLSSAFTRALSSPMPTYSISSRYGRPDLQYWSLRTATDRMPGLNSLTLYGPVPMPALKSVVPSLTPRITGRSASGPVSVTMTSPGPVAFTSSIWPASDLALEPVAGFLWRMSENTTSAGVSGLPSWKLTPLRSLNTQTFASLLLNSSASAGCGVRLPSSPPP